MFYIFYFSSYFLFFLFFFPLYPFHCPSIQSILTLGAAVTHRRCGCCKQQRGATGSLEGVEKEGRPGAPASRSRRHSTSRRAQPWHRLWHCSAFRHAAPRDELPAHPASRRALPQHELSAPPGLPRCRGTSSVRHPVSHSAAARAPFGPSRRVKVAG